VIAAPEPDDTNVVDLMAALRNSLKGSATSKKPTAKTATTKVAVKKKPTSRKSAA
jgi:DNA end-binding protein Ku